MDNPPTAELSQATFWVRQTEMGPIVTVLPNGLQPLDEGRDAWPDAPTPELLLAVADLAVNAALAADADLLSAQRLDSRPLLSLLRGLMPIYERSLFDLTTRTGAGDGVRRWAEREAMAIAGENAYSARLAARAQGLADARQLIRLLARGLAETDATARALLLASNATLIADAVAE